MNVSNCAYYSGPNCTWGFPYWNQQCLQVSPGTVRGDYAWAECVLDASSQLEQSFFAQRQYFLTLWPAFIGLICSFGPDPADMVFDNVWWAVLFAITCAGLPGLDSRKPRHHATTEWVDKGRQLCKSHPEQWDPARPQIIPRSFGRPNLKQVEAIVRIEWLGYGFGWLCWIVFNVLFVMALSQSTVWSVHPNVAAGYWYWLSAGPAVLSACAEALHGRVELYEPSGDTSSIAAGTDATNDLLMSKPREIRVDGLQMSSQARSAMKGPSTTVTPTTPAASNVSPPHVALYQYQRSHRRNFFDLWSCIIRLQFQRKKYRLLVKAEDDRWPFLFWKMVVSLSRVTVFALGSITMGGILLMPQPNDQVLLILLLFLTAIPRMIFFGIWRNKARGADLVVICDQLAANPDDLASIRHNSSRAPEAGAVN